MRSHPSAGQHRGFVIPLVRIWLFAALAGFVAVQVLGSRTVQNVLRGLR